MRLSTCLASLFCLLVLGGCFRSYHDLSDTLNVRQTRLIGKTYDVIRDLPIVKDKDGRFDRASDTARSSEYFPVVGVLSRGTVVRMQKVVREEVPPEYSLEHPLAIIEGGQHAGRRISLVDEFAYRPPAIPDYNCLLPHPSRPISPTRMTAWLADIRDPDFALRYWAARYLGELTPPFSPEVLAALLPATADIDPEVRLQAMLGLKRGLSADPPIIRALIAALQRRDDPAFTWEVARDSLAKIGAPALTEVVKLLDSNEREILTRAVDVLEKSGPAARPFLPKLAALIGDNRIHYSTITSAMREIDVAASVQLLVPMARNPQRRENVLAALGDLGGSFYHVDKPSPVADQIVAVLTDALDDPSDHIRSVAVASLRQLGWRAKPALPKLRAMLKSIPEDAQWPKLQRKTVEQVIWEIE